MKKCLWVLQVKKKKQLIYCISYPSSVNSVSEGLDYIFTLKASNLEFLTAAY